jgi:hypothetical protein
MKSKIAAVPALAALALAFGACANTPTQPTPGQGTASPQGRTMYATTQDNKLAKFGSDNPSTSATTIAFSGMASGETMLGLDFGPKDGLLYGVSNQNRLFTINTTTAAVTLVGSGAFTPGITGSAIGFDFNPTVNRIRVQSNTGFNLRLNQELGLVIDFDPITIGIQADASLSYNTGDQGAGSTPSIVADAYTNSNATATTTTLFAIDSSRDTLVSFTGNPNDGKISTVGSLGVNTTDAAGFDISGAADGTAFATLTPSGATASSLYTINLTSGQATLVGSVGSNLTLTGVAIAP